MARQTVPTRPDRIKWLLLAGAVVLVALLGWYGWHRYINYRHGGGVTVDRHRFPIAGIDVSNHNGVIDFDQVRDDDYQFVYIKASEGATYRDNAFERNYRDARAAGLAVGAYHYFRKNRDGELQARNLLAAVAGKTLDLPLVLDIEDDGKDTHVEHGTAVKRAIDMANHLKRHGYRVMIYTNGNGYRQYYKDNFAGEDLWLCSFRSPGSVLDANHTMQQYTHIGRVQGVRGAVDLNVFMGNKRAWNRYLETVNATQSSTTKNNKS